MRLGFSVRILGRPGLRGYDGRRAASSPHLSVSLAHLRDSLSYLRDAGIRMYRMAPDLAPYATDPRQPELHHQIDECLPELEAAGALARDAGVRLSFHAPAHVALASLDADVVARSLATLAVLADLLDTMRQPDEAVIVVHAGGLGGGADAAIGRWVHTWERMALAVRRRLALEHDGHGLTLPDTLRIHAATGVPIVFDHLHFRLNNPERWSLREALTAALGTWPAETCPKTHFASPRTELRAVQRRSENNGRRRWLLAPPRPGHHADYVNAWEFESFICAGKDLRDFDVMLEAKAGDLALLRLRDDLARYAPEAFKLLELASSRP